MTKIVKFSKSYENILKIKNDFYKNNKINLNNSLKLNNIYKKQPLRKLCKNCGSKKLNRFIKNFKIEYKLCSLCGHLNGMHQDTNSFAKKIYNEIDGKNYAKNYLKDYDQRVKSIYIPKVEFLKKVIKKKLNSLTWDVVGVIFLRHLRESKYLLEDTKHLNNYATLEIKNLKKIKSSLVNLMKFINYYRMKVMQTLYQ